jgi:hypothetical protein
MNPPDLDRPPLPLDQRTPLEIAMEPGPLPWPETLADNIRELERPFQPPTRRKEKDVHRVLAILDQLQKGGEK